MPNGEQQNPQPPNTSARVTLREIYESLCPTCRNALLDLLTGKAEAAGIRDILLRQLEGEPNAP